MSGAAFIVCCRIAGIAQLGSARISEKRFRQAFGAYGAGGVSKFRGGFAAGFAG